MFLEQMDACLKMLRCSQAVDIMAENLFNKALGVATDLLHVGGIHGQDLVLSFQWPAIGQKSPCCSVGAKMEHPVVLSEHLGFISSMLEHNQEIQPPIFQEHLMLLPKKFLSAPNAAAQDTLPISIQCYSDRPLPP